VSDRLIRFPGSSWAEIEGLPQPLTSHEGQEIISIQHVRVDT